MVQGQVFLKGEGLTLFLFNLFKVYHFYIQKLLYPCKIVLCIWRTIISFCHHNFLKKGHSKLYNNEPENIP